MKNQNLKTKKLIATSKTVAKVIGNVAYSTIAAMFVQTPADRQIQEMRDHVRVYLHAM